MLWQDSLSSGTVIVSDGGVSAPGVDFISVYKGKGAMALCQIQELINYGGGTYYYRNTGNSARELALVDEAVLTIGTIHAGQAPNVIGYGGDERYDTYL